MYLLRHQWLPSRSSSQTHIVVLSLNIFPNFFIKSFVCVCFKFYRAGMLCSLFLHLSIFFFRGWTLDYDYYFNNIHFQFIFSFDSFILDVFNVFMWSERKDSSFIFIIIFLFLLFFFRLNVMIWCCCFCWFCGNFSHSFFPFKFIYAIMLQTFLEITFYTKTLHKFFDKKMFKKIVLKSQKRKCFVCKMSHIEF